MKKLLTFIFIFSFLIIFQQNAFADPGDNVCDYSGGKAVINSSCAQTGGDGKNCIGIFGPSVDAWYYKGFCTTQGDMETDSQVCYGDNLKFDGVTGCTTQCRDLGGPYCKLGGVCVSSSDDPNECALNGLIKNCDDSCGGPEEGIICSTDVGADNCTAIDPITGKTGYICDIKPCSDPLKDTAPGGYCTGGCTDCSGGLIDYGGGCVNPAEIIYDDSAQDFIGNTGGEWLTIADEDHIAFILSLLAGLFGVDIDDLSSMTVTELIQAMIDEIAIGGDITNVTITSANPVFVGISDSAYSASGFGSYEKANLECATSTGDPALDGSHVCSVSEMLFSYKDIDDLGVLTNEALDAAIGEAWVNGGSPAYVSNVRDCKSWTATDSSEWGRFWSFGTPHEAKLTDCASGVGSGFKFACCK